MLIPNFVAWSLAAVALVVSLIYCLFNRPLPLAMTVLATPIAFQYLTVMKPLNWATHILFPLVLAHLVLVLSATVGYFIIGVIIAVVKWMDFVSTAKNAVRIAQIDTEGKNDTVIKTAVYNALVSTTGYSHRPMIREHKARFFKWATLWFIVGPWMILNNPVRRFYNWVYLTFAGRLQAISDRAFKDVTLP